MATVQRNYSKELERLIAELNGRKPKLLLHACCAPCSSYVLEYLSRYFSIALLYYNPNISPVEEYEKRKQELNRLVAQMPLPGRIEWVETDYGGEAFEKISAGLETVPEGGARCLRCYELRLREAAKAGKALHCDYFATTLSISPMKNSRVLNEIGERVGAELGIRHLPSDFKKKEGYKRSLELSREYGLYRQNYCGCVFSRREVQQREEQKGEKEGCQ